MAVKTPDTEEEQNIAHNPSQQYYDEEFNKITGAGHSYNADNLKKLEDYANSDVGKGIQEAERYANSNTKNIDDVGEQERAGTGPWNTQVEGKNKIPITAKDWVKKRGPLGALLLVLVGGGGTLGFFGMTLMPITLAEQFTNDTNDMNASSQRKFVSVFAGKLGGLQNKVSICNKAISFRCKLKSLDPKLVARFEDKGFKFGEKTQKGGRIVFSSIEFPPERPGGPAGPAARTVNELKQVLKNSAHFSQFNSVVSIKNSLLLGKPFTNALTQLHITKAKKIDGKSKQDADKSYEESVKGERGTPATTESVADRTNENASDEERARAQANTDSGNETSRTVNEAIARGQKIQSLSLRTSNALLVPQLICLTYNMAGYIATSAKIIKATRFIGFAMIFLTLASSIKAGKATDAEVEKGMSILAPSEYPTTVTDPETGQQIPNPYINKNVFDAEAARVVMYGDQINLTGIAKSLFVAGGFLGLLDRFVTFINQHLGKEFVKTTCKVVNSTVAKVIAFLAAPAIAAGLIVAFQVLPVEEWGAALVNSAIDAAAGFDLTTNAIGPTAGNIIFIGAALIMGRTAMNFGLKPGPLSRIKQNMAANNELIEQDIAMQKYNAKDTPLDINNRYSFLGSLAFQVASFVPTYNEPLGASVGRLFSLIPTALGSLTKNANAAYSMPVADYSETRFNQCQDDAYAEFGAVGNGVTEQVKPDMFCPMRYVPHNEVASDVAISYLEGQGSIDENGVAQPGSFLEKYIKYCGEGREDPWGSTSVPIESQTDGADWYTGRECIKETIDNQMASEFIGYKAVQDTIDSDIGGSPSTSQQALWNSPNKDFSFADILSLQLSAMSSQGAQ